MTTDVLLKLIDAGYSKEEISLMEETETKPIAQPAEPEQPAEPAEPDAPKPAEPTPSESMTKTIEEIMQVIGKMQKTLDGMQKKNAAAAEGKQPERMTADAVIRDFFGEKKKA